MPPKEKNTTAASGTSSTPEKRTNGKAPKKPGRRQKPSSRAIIETEDEESDEEEVITDDMRRVGKYIIGLLTVEYMRNTDFIFVAFWIPNFRETYLERLFELLCPKNLRTTSTQTRGLRNYFESQFINVSKVLRQVSPAVE
ncbi:hypothetical protein BJ508DRAFT_308705 [Ascobolus immersus RN42]|uniref:Uncharacterized protein n=1 Tax=Ascobolus immersus RN42 TaxID=1160509 RepID=A0A3N4I166_ASCIM|nr:hypothetical protein BJ508DRAFT_308705 [Ascobolus immersus RN42]